MELLPREKDKLLFLPQLCWLSAVLNGDSN